MFCKLLTKLMPVVEHNDDEQKHNSSFKLIYTYNWSQIFLFIVCSLESLFNTLLFVLNKLKFLWFYPVCELQRYSHFLDDPFPRPTSGCTSIYNAGSPEKYVLKTNLNGLLFFFLFLQDSGISLIISCKSEWDQGLKCLGGH